MVSGASVDEGLVASSPLATEIHHTGSGPIAASADEADQNARELGKKEVFFYSCHYNFPTSEI